MSKQPGVDPTIVFVHGAFADASRWNGVIERLQQQGDPVVRLRRRPARGAHHADVCCQHPVAAVAFSEAIGPPAWRRLPSWAVVATGDKAAGSDVIRPMAQRAAAAIAEVEGSRVITVSQPPAFPHAVVEVVGY
jgi:hypothetical protein